MVQMNDGFSTTVAFAEAPTAGLLVFEKEVTPPGMSAGGPIETSTMLNTAYRTMIPKSLITLEPMSMVVAYDPDAYTALIAAIGKNNSIVITFPNSETLTFFGWIDEFTPGAQVEGEQPTADMTIQPSNVDLAGAEIAPVMA